MPRPPKAREPLKQAALQLFVERGVHATGIREIAKHAGCSEAALYRHWPNKDALTLALFQEHLSEVVQLLDTAMAGEAPFLERLRASVAAMFTLYDEQPLVFRLVLLVQHELAQVLPEDMRMPQDVLADAIFAEREHQAQKKLSKKDQEESILVSAAIIGIFLQVATYVIYGRMEGPLNTYTDSVTDLCVKTLS